MRSVIANCSLAVPCGTSVSVKLGEPEHHAKDAEKAKAPDVASKSAKPAMTTAAAFWYLPPFIMYDYYVLSGSAVTVLLRRQASQRPFSGLDRSCLFHVVAAAVVGDFQASKAACTKGGPDVQGLAAGHASGKLIAGMDVQIDQDGANKY